MFDIITLMNPWPGFICTGAVKDEASKTLTINLEPEPGSEPICSHCGNACVLIHDTCVREISEMPILGYHVKLRVLVRRPECLHCGSTANERIDWLKPYARVTERLRSHIEHRTEAETIKYAARETNLGWKTVKEIDKERLTATVGQFQWDGATHLVVDEFALHKKHRYATVVLNPDRKHVLWVGKGRSLETMNQFFDLLTEEQKAGILSVSMDMSTAFDIGVRTHCPNAEVVYDLFHALKLYGMKVVDRIRVDTANEFKSDPQKRKLIKGSRWLLMKRPEDLDKKSYNKLSEAIKLNADLMKAYLMADELRHLWFLGSEKEAESLFDGWIQKATDSRIDCLVHFARVLKNYKAGIVASSKFRGSTSILEGINNRIKVIKRMAYGFRDDAYFFLKIKHAFPGIG